MELWSTVLIATEYLGKAERMEEKSSFGRAKEYLVKSERMEEKSSFGRAKEFNGIPCQV